jgi:uncharacterized membrane-anchored protein
MDTGAVPTLTTHPLRRAVLDEVHARPFQLVAPPRRFLMAAYTTTHADAETARAALDQWCAATSAERPEADAKFHRAVFPDASLRWESHTEFTTWTWDAAAPPGEPFAWPLPNPSPIGATLAVPGALLVGIDLALVAAAASMETLFDATSLCVSSAYDGAALIATDFRQDARGNTRILIVDKGLGPARAGALVQRVMEIETYRTFALLGLPEAARVSPLIGRIEKALVATTERMKTTMGLEGNASLLDQLVAMAAELESEAAVSAYRFAATRAYDAIVRSRIEAIQESPVEGYSTWRAFLDRRMGPAMRTCQSVADRQAELSTKLTRAANLLRTRVDVEMQSQNKTLLEAMNRRANLQLRLQQTVEGLSVAAVTYYMLGLLSYAFTGLKDAGLVAWDTGVATAVALPFVLGAVWWTVRRIRRGTEGADKG